MTRSQKLAISAALSAATCIAAPVYADPTSSIDHSAGAALAYADNTKFPERQAEGPAPDSLGGGKAPALAATADAPPPITVDPVAGTVTPAPGTLPARVQEAPLEVAQDVVKSVRAGQGYRYAAAAALAALMVLGLKLSPRIFGKTDRGKALAVMILATLGAASTAVASDTSISPGLFTGALGVAFTAVGGRQWLSRLLWPRDGGRAWLEWLKPWLGVDQGPPF